MTFEELGVEPSLIERLASGGISAPTAVQERVIPALASGGDVVFESETGTGKTLAYLLPIAAALSKKEGGACTRLLVAAPTYELAAQIKAQVQAFTGLSAALCIGGAPIKRQIESLRSHPDVVIGGPSRLVELVHLKKLKTERLSAVVFDEADRLLSPELREGTLSLIERLPQKIQVAACSATISDRIRKVLSDALGGRNFDSIRLPPEDVLRSRISHWAIFSERRDKVDTLRSFLSAEKPAKALVFTGRLDQVDSIVSKLKFKGVSCAGIHSKTDKVERKAALDRFRSGKCPVIVTSDLMARGMDIPGITHVIQMDLPESDDFYVHRAGRTGRAGSLGVSVLIGDSFEMRKFSAMEKRLKIAVQPKMLYKGGLVAPSEVMEVEGGAGD